MNNPASAERQLLNWPKSLTWATTAVTAFHLAYAASALSFLMLVFLFALFQLRNLGSKRKAFYFGLIIGFAIYAPQLHFFWKIFGPAAIPLWLVLSFWMGLFLLLSQLATSRFGEMKSALLIPFLWTGLEYFRSELYYLRFSWINVGYAFSDWPTIISNLGGVYGVGFFFLFMITGAWLFYRLKLLRRISAIATVVVIIGIVVLLLLASTSGPPSKRIKVAGIQLEFPSSNEVIPALDKLHTAAPEAELILLSEYTFDGPIPNNILDWKSC